MRGSVDGQAGIPPVKVAENALQLRPHLLGLLPAIQNSQMLQDGGL
jgi:hypothetical protein